MGFEIGDVVQLKSGGPKMTVQSFVGQPSAQQNQGFGGGIFSAFNIPTSPEEVYKMAGFGNGDVICQWFDNKGRLKTSPFRQDVLVRCDDDD